MSECDEAPGLAVESCDPPELADPPGRLDDPDPVVQEVTTTDVVQAVADFVEDLVEDGDANDE